MQSGPVKTPNAFLDLLLAGFFGGVFGGCVLLILSLRQQGLHLRSFNPSDAVALWVFVRSLAVIPLLAGALGTVLAIPLYPILRRSLHGLRWTFVLVAGISFAAVAFAELTARGQLMTLGGLPLADPARRMMALRHGFFALGLGSALGALLWWADAKRSHRQESRGSKPRRSAFLCISFFLLLWLVADWALLRSSSSPANPRKVVVVGLDGMTFRVLTPLLRQGRLPTFQRLVEEGAWGTFMTYGTASSPRVWTTLATGHRVRDHGIDDFVHAEKGSYRALPMKSFDRKTRALWNILGDAGHRVAVVNWLITFPPEEVNGVMVPRLNTRRTLITHPPEMAMELRSLLPPLPKVRRSTTFPHFKNQIDRTFDAAEHLLTKESPAFLAFMNASSDAAQHRLWKFYEPAAFEPSQWNLKNLTAQELAERGAVIPNIYRHLDHRLGQLLNGLDEETLLIVLSDHGQGPAVRPRVHLRLDRLLVDLGWAEPAEDSEARQPLNLRRSRAYPLVETPWTPMMRVNLNLKGREAQGIVAPEQADSLRRRLADQLAAVRFENGTPLFGEIKIRDSTSRSGVDLRLPLAAHVRDPQKIERILHLGEQAVPLRRYLEIDTSISGEHHPQGVIFLHGPGVRTGYLGQRVLTTSLHELVWHLTDKIDAVDAFLPPLRRLGLLDTATTLDLTPTVLHKFGLPVARDMEGRPLLETDSAPQPVQWIETWEREENRETEEKEEGDEDQEMLDRLRSLGYVN